MDLSSPTVAVGVFPDSTAAQQAIHQLKARGFTENQIGFASPGHSQLEGATELRSFHAAPSGGIAVGAATGATVGALWGLGIVAGVLPAVGPAIAGGTLAAILASAATGAAVAGVAGALIDFGISEEEAQYYDREFRLGRTIVTVHAGDRHQEAADYFRRAGAFDFDNRRLESAEHGPN